MFFINYQYGRQKNKFKNKHIKNKSMKYKRMEVGVMNEAL